MGESAAKQSVHQGTYKCTEDDDEDAPVAMTDQHEHRPGASTDHSPSQTEYDPSDEVSGDALVLRIEADGLPIHVLGLPLLHGLDDDYSQNHRTADDSIHMECIEPEHLIDTVPGDDLRFAHDHTEEDPGQ